ncbi:hypothetical protein TMatcc_010892 [Talaromyces marneffei ATCC 18224]
MGKLISKSTDSADFIANLVSLRQLRKQGIWWDGRRGFDCLRDEKNRIVAYIKDREGQFVLEYITHDHPMIKTGFMIRRHRFNSWTSRKERKANAERWHARLGHPGPQIIEYLAGAGRGVRLTGLSKGPTTVECEACASSKIHRLIRREDRRLAERPGEHLALDFHDFEKSTLKNDKDKRTLILITDCYSGFMWDFYLTGHTTVEILETLKWFFQYLKKRYNMTPVKIEMDNEITHRHLEVKDWIKQQHVTIKTSVAYTQS